MREIEFQGPRRLAYSIDEAARATGCCRDQIYEAIREKKLIARKLGKRRTVILEESLRAFLSGLPILQLSDDPKGSEAP